MRHRRLVGAILSAASCVLLVPSCTSTTDDTPPIVRLLSPHYGDTLDPGLFTMTAEATDDQAMRRVSFWAGSELLGFDEYPKGDTYRLLVDASTGLSGWVMLEANAVDQTRNQSFDTVRVYFTP